MYCRGWWGDELPVVLVAGCKLQAGKALKRRRSTRQKRKRESATHQPAERVGGWRRLGIGRGTGEGEMPGVLAGKR